MGSRDVIPSASQHSKTRRGNPSPCRILRKGITPLHGFGTPAETMRMSNDGRHPTAGNSPNHIVYTRLFGNSEMKDIVPNARVQDISSISLVPKLSFGDARFPNSFSRKPHRRRSYCTFVICHSREKSCHDRSVPKQSLRPKSSFSPRSRTNHSPGEHPGRGGKASPASSRSRRRGATECFAHIAEWARCRLW